MKLMITGGAGFIGSALVKLALKRGHEVLNVDLLTYAANAQSLKGLSGHSHYHFLQASIADASAMRTAVTTFQPDAIMNLAAESHVDRSIDGPSPFIQTNVVGTFTLLEAARNYWEGLSQPRKDRFRFHHISTDEVYGDLELSDPAFEETTPYDPSSPYSATKAASDHLVRAWARTYGLPTLITNCSNNYGPFQFPEKLIPVVILKALHGQSIPVYGTGENIRDWLYVEDHVEALLTVLEAGKVGETYNIGGKTERSNIDLVRSICALMSKHLPGANFDYASLITFVQDRPGHDKRYAINPSKIERELSWFPSISLDEGLEKTIKWYVENEWWWRPLVDEGAFGARLGLETPE